jgi:drug/metabolite transporter (DMT)-like permease
MTFGGVINTIIALSLNEHHTVVWTTRGVAATIYLTIFGSLVGFTAYIWLLEHVATAKVATYAYVNPVVAVLLGWLILHEKIDRFILVGAAIIVSSVVLVTMSKLKAPASRGATILPACEAEA